MSHRTELLLLQLKLRFVLYKILIFYVRYTPSKIVNCPMRFSFIVIIRLSNVLLNTNIDWKLRFSFAYLFKVLTLWGGASNSQTISSSSIASRVPNIIPMFLFRKQANFKFIPKYISLIYKKKQGHRLLQQ